MILLLSLLNYILLRIRKYCGGRYFYVNISCSGYYCCLQNLMKASAVNSLQYVYISSQTLLHSVCSLQEICCYMNCRLKCIETSFLWKKYTEIRGHLQKKHFVCVCRSRMIRISRKSVTDSISWPVWNFPMLKYGEINT